MADGGMSESQPKAKVEKKSSFKWRAWLRAFHRDIGYVAVGLTFIYALSGIAVNHRSTSTDRGHRSVPAAVPSTAEVDVAVGPAPGDGVPQRWFGGRSGLCGGLILRPMLGGGWGWGWGGPIVIDHGDPGGIDGGWGGGGDVGGGDWG